ncbi:hypothetical protein Glove_44g38 [Diversispora epigaea]|uniref:MULE transposase domain-containing protein n=1 Tax=Diversispora epigaea TaxID=1348612 RepID=A0A397JPH6_9GLOM|nr:hypothetical protein Glove_44g38 [Diversispora epigaea]
MTNTDGPARKRSNLLKQLLAKKSEELGWEVFWEINNETKSLDKVFWMSPEQVQLWMTYHDVILNDNTHKTNHFNMPLSLFIVVNNHFCSRLVAQALVNNETKETYEWLLTSTFQYGDMGCVHIRIGFGLDWLRLHESCSHKMDWIR